ncbi:transposase [Vibrio sp. 1F169]|uniref:transposase n=1 Tax=Vibrio sp. 1F169 TaxID=3230005 RepID=UPI00352EF430
MTTTLPDRARHILNEVQITNLYTKRMQIEEAFRDLKSAAYGIALRHNRTRCTKRLDILILVALLAEILMWWNGLIAVQAKWHFDIQANSIKHRRVLSIPRLGREVWIELGDIKLMNPNINGECSNIKGSHTTQD